MERTVFPCEEFGEIEVPLDRLYVGGRIDVYPDLTRFFDIDYRSGRIVLVAKSYVGLIPVNDRIAIHVVPRFPISNLFYILQRAESKLHFITGHTRAYALTGQTGKDPGAIFGDRLMDMLSHIRKEGLLRRYVPRTYDDRIDGEFLFSDTVSMFYSRGVRHRQVRRVTELSTDIVENRLIKSAVEKLARYYSNAPGKVSRRQGRIAAEALTLLFDGVSRFECHPRAIQDSLPQHIRQLPSHHKPYATLLWIAYLIEGRQGIAIEKVGRATFDTFVVNLADVFENYVRQVIMDNISEMLPGYFVKDGNVEQVPLFAQGQAMKVKPDIYLVCEGRPPVVLDAKYKPSTKPADRYEVLAFCEALRSKLAIMLSPSIGGLEMELLGKTQGGVNLHIARIDLGSNDMKIAETTFITNLKKIFTPLLSAP